MTLQVFDFEQRTEEWYAARRGILTASVVGQLVTAKTMKVADNDTARKVIEQLTAERITGTTDSTYTNDDMMRGILDEPLAVEKYAEYYAPVTTTGFMVRREDDWTLGYSPDGLVDLDGLIEVKCPRAKAHLRTLLIGDMPSQHMAQVQAGLLVTGRKWCDFISYYGGMPLFVSRVFPDDTWQEVITAACRTYEDQAARIIALYDKRAATLPATERLEIAV